LQVGGGLHTAKLGERWEQVDQTDRRCRNPSGFRHAGRDEQKGNPRSLFEQAHLLPEAVLARVVAVVARENDHRIAGETQTVERVHDLPDLRIHEADAGVVRLAALAAEVIG
jgi:hypothetical protein